MLDKQGFTSTDRCRPFKATTNQLALEFDYSTNRHIREMPCVYGLRTSLFRLKVINALVRANREGRLPGVRGVHADMQASASELTIVSVREVLKRLCAEGVINLGSDKCYSLNPQARAVLDQTAPR